MVSTVEDKQFRSFEEDGSKWMRRTINAGELVNVAYDEIAFVYTTLTDVITYKLDNAQVRELTVTYTNASKGVIASVKRTA